MMKFIRIGGFALFVLASPIFVRAQHTLQTNLRNTNSVASTAVNLGKMYEGAIGRDFIRFRKLLALRDGEIRYDVKQKSENEKIYLRFRADTAVVQAFEMRLEKDSLFLVHPTRTLSKWCAAKQVFCFTKTAAFSKVIHCLTIIL